jgi:VIT1/CCC1 family predicted Fe2+/Mn2+ transporter
MKKILLFIITLFSHYVTLAEMRNKTIIEYFIQNNFIEFLIHGGYYTLGVIVVLIIISSISKTFRRIILSIILAIFGLLMLLFVFEALDNLEWIPPTY